MPFIFLTDTTLGTWTVPADWTNAGATFEVIGAGGAGYNATSNTGTGGEAGHYAKRSNLNLAPGQVLNIHIGAGGLHGNPPTAGGATWIGGISLATSICGALGGAAATNSASNATTATTNDVGDIVRAGGFGAGYGGNHSGGSAGGGAAGPGGVGGNGAPNTVGGGGAGGGGAGNTGGAGGAGTVDTGTTGGTGGVAGDGTAGGTPGTGSSVPGGPGSHGSGGGGGPTSGNLNGGDGGVGQDASWDPSHGPGGGGGGGGLFTGAGGKGGLYGGGGAGAGWSGGVGGDGAQGLGVIFYNRNPAPYSALPGNLANFNFLTASPSFSAPSGSQANLNFSGIGSRMSGMTNYWACKLIDHSTGKTAIGSAPTISVGLFTTAPTDAGGGTEVTGGSYARKTTAGSDWNAASGGGPSLTTNANAITFVTATADWGTALAPVVAFGGFDASSGGNLLWWDYLSADAWVPFSCSLASPGVLTVPSHGFGTGDKCVISSELGGTLPATGGSWAGILTITALSADTFSVGVNTTTTGSGFVRRIVPTPIFNGQTASFAPGALTVTQA